MENRWIVMILAAFALVLAVTQAPSGVVAEQQQQKPQPQSPPQLQQQQSQQEPIQDLLDRPNAVANKNPSSQAHQDGQQLEQTTRIPNQSTAFDKEPVPQNKTEAGLMAKMHSLADQGKEIFNAEERDSHTVYRDPESTGMTSRKPEIFEKMAKSAELGRKAARENHGSNGTHASFVRASEIGAVERIQQILIKTQEHLRNNAQKVDDKISEYARKMRDKIFKSSS